VQLPTASSTERGEVTLFVIQPDYWLAGDLRAVARSDHGRDAPGGHDVTEDGLYRARRRRRGSRQTTLCRRMWALTSLRGAMTIW